MDEFLSGLWLSCGLRYSFLLVMSFLTLFVGGFVTWFRLRSREAAVIYVVLTVIPLLIGIVGTVEGCLNVLRYSMASPEEPIRHHYCEAFVTTCLGAVITVPHLILGLAAVARSRRDTSQTVTDCEGSATEGDVMPP